MVISIDWKRTRKNDPFLFVPTLPLHLTRINFIHTLEFVVKFLQSINTKTMSTKENQNQITYFMVRTTLYKSNTGAVEGVALYRIDDWENFKLLTEEEQVDYFRGKATDNFSKKSKKHITGNPGTVYSMEYKDGEGGQYSIYPNTARYITRVKTSYAHKWDEIERSEGSANRAKAINRKQEKLRLRDSMTFEMMKDTYRNMTTPQRAAFIQSMLNELLKIR